jgi:phage regulator Rha-like protein
MVDEVVKIKDSTIESNNMNIAKLQKIEGEKQYLENMINKAVSGEEYMTTSVELSEITGKRHDNIVRDIEKLNEVYDKRGDLKCEATYYTDKSNRQSKQYILNKLQVLTLISGYSIDLRITMVNRIDKLEGLMRDAKIVKIESELTAQNDQLEYATTILGSGRGIKLSDVAKIINDNNYKSDHAIRKVLNDNHLIRKLDNGWSATSTMINDGILENETKIHTEHHKDGSYNVVSSIIKVLPEGIDYIRSMLDLDVLEKASKSLLNLGVSGKYLHLW